MVRTFKRTRRVLSQWPPIVAEMANLRDPEPMRDPAGPLPDPAEWQRADFAAHWIGQATLLLRIGSTTILTDPHFRDRAGPRVRGVEVGRRRSTALPGPIDALPPIDVVLLSHAHFDHWDKPTLARLADARTCAVIPKGTRDLLPGQWGDVIEVPWSGEASAGHLRIRPIRPAHAGARWGWDTQRQYHAYVIESDARRVFFGGDTADTDAFDALAHLRPLRAAPSPIDIAILGIGNSYEPWAHRHATPEQSADMARRMNAHAIIAMHHATFRDPVEPIDEPMARFQRAWDPTNLLCTRIGNTWYA